MRAWTKILVVDINKVFNHKNIMEKETTKFGHSLDEGKRSQ